VATPARVHGNTSATGGGRKGAEKESAKGRRRFPDVGEMMSGAARGGEKIRF